MTVKLSSFGALFDRRRASHRWFSAFVELEGRGGSNAVICGNWRMDHRVADDREGSLLKAPEFAAGPTGEQWCEQRYNYFERAIRRPTFPGTWGPCSAYLDPPNQSNAIGHRTLPGHEQLVHAASLNSILRRLTTGSHETGELRLRFFELTGHALPLRRAGGALDHDLMRSKVREIAEAANAGGSAVVKSLAQLLCDALGVFQPPWWACFAAEVAPLIATGEGAALCQALGMGHVEAGEWLLAWRYDLNLLGRLYPGVPLFRPTVVEANDNPCHYPAPPGYSYGITMPLSGARRGALREVLHPPLFAAAAHEACTGSLIPVGTPPLVDHNELGNLRRAHRQRLILALGGPDTRDWLDRHPDLS